MLIQKIRTGCELSEQSHQE